MSPYHQVLPWVSYPTHGSLPYTRGPCNQIYHPPETISWYLQWCQWSIKFPYQPHSQFIFKAFLLLHYAPSLGNSFLFLPQPNLYQPPVNKSVLSTSWMPGAEVCWTGQTWAWPQSPQGKPNNYTATTGKRHTRWWFRKSGTFWKPTSQESLSKEAMSKLKTECKGSPGWDLHTQNNQKSNTTGIK
jgi:hypothetical protein